MNIESGGFRLFLTSVLIAASFATVTGRADEIQERFDGAMQAIDQDRLRSARRTLNELLAENPNLQRVRLELARVNYLSYDFDEAERLAQQVLDDPNTPPSVQTTVLAFLAQIREDRARFADRHLWTPSFYGGLMYDSNVNFGPSRDIIDIGGVPFTVLASSREQSDLAWVVNPALSHTFNSRVRFQAGEHTGFFAWQSQASGYYRGYFDEDDFNLGVLTLRTGPAWIVPDRWRAAFGLQGDQIWLGDENLALFTSLNPNFIWEITDDTELEFEGQVTYRNYWKSRDDDREGWYERIGLAVNHYLADDRVTLQAGLGYNNFSADDDQWSYAGPDAFAGIVVNVWTNGTVYGRIGYRKFDFDANPPPFTVGRDDDEFRYTLGLQHDFRSGWLRNWSFLANWDFTDNKSSDVPIFDYERHEINVGLSRVF